MDDRESNPAILDRLSLILDPFPLSLRLRQTSITFPLCLEPPIHDRNPLLSKAATKRQIIKGVIYGRRKISDQNQENRSRGIDR
jgi:hypothetical protein